MHDLYSKLVRLLLAQNTMANRKNANKRFRLLEYGNKFQYTKKLQIWSFYRDKNKTPVLAIGLAVQLCSLTKLLDIRTQYHTISDLSIFTLLQFSELFRLDQSLRESRFNQLGFGRQTRLCS